MSYIDQEFAERALSKCLRFKKIPGSSFKLQMRCPICGDSKKDEFKARFWAKEYEDTVMLKCFNCEYSNSLSGYLKNEEPELYREFLLEKRKSSFNTTQTKKVDEVKEEKAIIEFLPYSRRLDTLDKNSKLIEYIRKRKIPERHYDKIYFTKEWQKLVNHINPNTFRKEKDEMRLVIPIFNADSQIESLQGRALVKDATIKYMTIKAYEGASKIYGMERINENNPVIVMEGPLDSLFIDNAIAITGGSLDLNTVPFKDNRIWALDNEPRHPDTLKRMKKLIDAREKVVFWDNLKYDGKDINEMIINGATSEYLLEYILQNNCSDLMAKLRFSKYAKI